MELRGTTIIGVKKNGKTIIAGDVGALDFEEAESYEEVVDLEDSLIEA